MAIPIEEVSACVDLDLELRAQIESWISGCRSCFIGDAGEVSCISKTLPWVLPKPFPRRIDTLRQDLVWVYFTDKFVPSRRT